MYIKALKMSVKNQVVARNGQKAKDVCLQTLLYFLCAAQSMFPPIKYYIHSFIMSANHFVTAIIEAIHKEQKTTAWGMNLMKGK